MCHRSFNVKYVLWYKMGLKSLTVLSVLLVVVGVLIQRDALSSARNTIATVVHDTLVDVFDTCPCEIIKNTISYVFQSIQTGKELKDKSIPIVRHGDDRLFTKEELSRYKGHEGDPGLYLAILGQVYDVAKGDKHYAPGHSYSCFTGIDGTKAFMTGEFTEKGLIDDVTGLKPEELLELENWIDFYDKTYEYKGKVVGNFYDETGKPTAALLEVKKNIDQAHLKKQKDEEFRKWFPPCNSAHTSAGGWVSCSDKSGGIKRDWVGVPRKYHFPGKSVPRCVCVRTTGPPYNDPESDSNHGDLDNPHLEEYEGCDPMSDTCKIL